MKMTWLHMEFVLIFSLADGQVKLGRTAAKQLLTLASLAVTKLDFENWLENSRFGFKSQ